MSASWFFVLFFLIWTLSGRFHDVLGGSQTTATAVAAASALTFFASLIVHELGHALVARRLGYQVDGIDLWFFGGVSHMRRDPDTAGDEFRIAVAGPLATLACVGVFIAIGTAVSSGGHFFDVALGRQGFRVTPALALVSWLAVWNVAIFAFNLVPAFPLDGGRIARAVIWWRTGDRNRGTRATGRAGQLFAILLGLYGLVNIRNGYGLLLVVLALILFQAAGGAVVQGAFGLRIQGVTVADVMDREPVTIPSQTTVLDAQEQFFLRYRWPWFAVVDGQHHFLGVLRHDRVDAEISAGRPALAASEVLDEDTTVRIAPEQPLETLLRAEGLRSLGAMVAVDGDGVLRGVVTLAQLRRVLAPTARA